MELICIAEVTRADLPSTKGGLLQAVQTCPSKYIHGCEKISVKSNSLKNLFKRNYEEKM